MNSLPPISRGALLTCQGLVLSAFEATAGVWAGQWWINGSVWRVRVPPGALPVPPQPGQVWECDGESAAHLEWGEQWVVTSGQRAMPKGQLVAPFLAHHVAGLTNHRAARWWKRWGSQLPDVLQQNKVHSLARLLGGPLAHEITLEALTCWTAQQLEVDIARLVHSWDGDDTLVAAVRDHYGSMAVSALRMDPYRLLAFAPFPRVDAMAQRAGVRAGDRRRLVGALESVVHARSDCGAPVLHEEVLVADTATCLDMDVDKARRALDLASETGVVRAVGGRTWMGEAAWRRCALIMDRLDRLVGAIGTTPAKDGLTHESDRYSIAAAIRVIEAAPLARVCAPTRAGRAKFAVAWRDFLARQGRYLDVFAESTELAHYLGAALGTSVPAQGADPFGVSEAGDTVLWACSSQRMQSLAGLLATRPSLKQLIVVDDGRAGNSINDTAALFANYQGTPTVTLTTEAAADDGVFAHLADDQRWDLVMHAKPYDARAGQWEGVRSFRTSSNMHAQAVIGVCHQQLRHGTVALVIDDPQERAKVHTQWTMESTALPSSQIDRALRVVRLVDLEPEEAATIVIAMPSSMPPKEWWIVALGKARKRVVIVGGKRVRDTAVARALLPPPIGASEVLRRVRPGERMKHGG